MLSRALFDLARQGFGFPKPNVFHSMAEAPKVRAFPKVRIRVLRPHYQLRRRVEVGEVLTLDAPSAADAVALRRAERI